MADLPKINWPEISITAGICLAVVVAALALAAFSHRTGSETQ